MGNHITERKKVLQNVPQPIYDGRRGYSGPVGPTDNVAAVGVGGGRIVRASGQQGQHGSVVQGKPPIANTKGQWPD